MIEYNIIRSKRKTIAIHITENAVVEVRTPLRTSKTEIDHFVTSKQDWINKHLAIKKQNLKDKATFILHYGDTIPMHGKEYPITENNGNRMGFDGECFYLPTGLQPEEIKYALIQVYKMIAKKLLTNKVIDYAKQTGLQPIAVKINSAKTRWGSCSNKKSINFSWRLIMADDDVIDYVVVHELAHIKEHNHSDRFWAIVAAVLPDYKERRNKLREFEKQLTREDWG